MDNPHSPTDAWLKSVCDAYGDIDPDVGDTGSHLLERESGDYTVEVEKVEE